MFLRNPKFGNAFTVNTRVVIHSLMDSELQVFRPSSQPDKHGFSVQFSALSDEEKDRLISFFESSAGEVITLQDHEATNWTGMITSPNIIFIENRIGCNWMVSFEFEGTKS